MGGAEEAGDGADSEVTEEDGAPAGLVSTLSLFSPSVVEPVSTSAAPSGVSPANGDPVLSPFSTKSGPSMAVWAGDFGPSR